MKKKYVLVKDNKEVKEGDTITVVIKGLFKNDTPITFTIGDYTLTYLIGMDIIKVITEEYTMDDVINHMSVRAGRSKLSILLLLYKMYSINKASVFSTLLKEVSSMINEEYDSPIKSSDNIFVISMLDGKITKVINRGGVKNLEAFAFFRTCEDASRALKILNRAHKSLFNNEK